MNSEYNITEIALSQWSVIIQISILVILTFAFIALWFKFPRHSIFNWMYAWISNLSGLLIIFIVLSLDNPSVWVNRSLFIMYSLFKIWYSILLINGLWRYSLANKTQKSRFMKGVPFLFLAYAFLLLAIEVPVIQIQMITFFMIGSILLVGSIYLFLQHNRYLVNLVLLVFCVEALLFIYHSWQLSPSLFGLPIEKSLTYMSFLDSMVELIVGMTCLFAVLFKVIEEQQTSNKEMELAQDSLRNMVDKDPLTGLLNRRQLKKFVASQNHQCALVYMDINKFKNINDIWGHAMGDKCLIEIARLMKELLEKEIGKFRLGGDEFLLVVPEEKISLIKSFNKEINRILTIDNETPAFSLAIGIAIMDGESGYEKALSQADKAMYLDKLKKL